jgi:LIM domain
MGLSPPPAALIVHSEVERATPHVGSPRFFFNFFPPLFGQAFFEFSSVVRSLCSSLLRFPFFIFFSISPTFLNVIETEEREEREPLARAERTPVPKKAEGVRVSRVSLSAPWSLPPRGTMGRTEKDDDEPVRKRSHSKSLNGLRERSGSKSSSVSKGARERGRSSSKSEGSSSKRSVRSGSSGSVDSTSRGESKPRRSNSSTAAETSTATKAVLAAPRRSRSVRVEGKRRSSSRSDGSHKEKDDGRKKSSVGKNRGDSQKKERRRMSQKSQSQGSLSAVPPRAPSAKASPKALPTPSNVIQPTTYKSAAIERLSKGSGPSSPGNKMLSGDYGDLPVALHRTISGRVLADDNNFPASPKDLRDSDACDYGGLPSLPLDLDSSYGGLPSLPSDNKDDDGYGALPSVRSAASSNLGKDDSDYGGLRNDESDYDGLPVDYDGLPSPRSTLSTISDDTLATAESAVSNPSTASVLECDECKEHIDGQGINVLGKFFHADCVSCSRCNVSLGGNLRTRDGVFYCIQCFDAAYGQRCTKCGERVKGKVASHAGKPYHPTCFTCSECRTPITGPFAEEDGKIICESCLDD